MSKNLPADVLTSVLLKSRRIKQNVQQRVKRSKDWLFYTYMSTCVVTGVDIPCNACDLCCKGKCNTSKRYVICLDRFLSYNCIHHERNQSIYLNVLVQLFKTKALVIKETFPLFSKPCTC